MKKLMMANMILFASLTAGAQELQVMGGNVGLLGTHFVAPTIDGKNNVYGPVAGEIIYDYSDSTFYGRTHSSTWAPLGGSAPGVPVGTVITFAGSTCPTGYFAADGASKNRTTYAELFSAIGTVNGAPDGSSFNLPDYRGRFLRGVDGSAGRDPDSSSRTTMNSGGNTGNAVGSVQDDIFESHGHRVYGGILGTAVSYNSGNFRGLIGADNLGAYFNTTGLGTNVVEPQGGNETRPTNAYVNFCIKY